MLRCVGGGRELGLTAPFRFCCRMTCRTRPRCHGATTPTWTTVGNSPAARFPQLLPLSSSRHPLPWRPLPLPSNCHPLHRPSESFPPNCQTNLNNSTPPPPLDPPLPLPDAASATARLATPPTSPLPVQCPHQFHRGPNRPSPL